MKSRAALNLKRSDSDVDPPKAAGHPVAEQPKDDVHADLEEVEVDGQRITFTAKEQIVLRCGKASITLTRAGKIIISGEYVVSRSSGVNRIRGGSVQIN